MCIRNNSGTSIINCKDIAGGFILIIVVIKMIAPRIEETPARCKEKIVRSTDALAWARLPASGGYTVHPVPAPASTIEDARIGEKMGGAVRNLCYLFGGMPCLGCQLLVEPVNFQILQL